MLGMNYVPAKNNEEKWRLARKLVESAVREDNSRGFGEQEAITESRISIPEKSSGRTRRLAADHKSTCPTTHSTHERHVPA